MVGACSLPPALYAASTIEWPVETSSKFTLQCTMVNGYVGWCLDTKHTGVTVYLSDANETVRPCAGWSGCYVTVFSRYNNSLYVDPAHPQATAVPEGTRASWKDIAAVASRYVGASTRTLGTMYPIPPGACNVVRVSASPISSLPVAHPPGMTGACDSVAPPVNQWCAPTESNLTFNFNTIKTPLTQASMSKNLGVYCTTDMKYSLKLAGLASGAFTLSNGITATITANSSPMGSTLNGRAGDQSVLITTTLSGNGSTGGFSGSSIISVNYP